MGPNGSKLFDTIQHGSKWIELGYIQSEMVKMGQSGPNWSKVGQTGKNWSKCCNNLLRWGSKWGPKLVKPDKNGSTRVKMGLLYKHCCGGGGLKHLLTIL